MSNWITIPDRSDFEINDRFGSSIMRNQVEDDAAYTNLILAQGNVLVPENELKWGRIRATPNEYDFYDADWIVNYCHSRGARVRGHTLLWGLTHPTWVNDFLATATEKQAYDLMIDHITTLVSRYDKKVVSWDVLNEPILTWDGRPDGLRTTNNPWLAPLSDNSRPATATGFIKTAFDAARAASPTAELVINQNYVEYPGVDQGGAGIYNGMRARFLDLLEELVRIGTPIDAVGIQGHLETTHTTFDEESFAQFLRDIASMGFDILITEMDVKDTNLPADIAVRDQQVADQYRQFLDVCTDNRAVREVVMWSIADHYSWYNEVPSAERPDMLPLRPLLFDSSLQPKLAYDAVQDTVRRLR